MTPAKIVERIIALNKRRRSFERLAARTHDPVEKIEAESEAEAADHEAALLHDRLDDLNSDF